MAQPIVNVAVQAARLAGDIIMRQRTQLDRVPVTEKGRGDFVSEVDRSCEDAIVREIWRHYPDHAILAEEMGEKGESECRWVIDPLDGTSNFLRDIPHYAISIAHQVNGRTEHGVIYDPFKEELFTASRGRGAFLNNRRLRVSPRITLDGAVLAMALPFRQRRHLPAYMASLRALFKEAEDIRRGGASALDLAYVAAGRLDAYWEIGIKPWDVAAGALMVRESGGVVQDFSGSDDVEGSGSIIAAPYKLMTLIQKVVRASFTR